MEFLIWPFVGLLVFVSWLVLLGFRGAWRAGGDPGAGTPQEDAGHRRHSLELRAHLAADAARFRAGRRKAFVEPEMTSGQITFAAEGEAEPAARRRAAAAR